MSNLELYDKVFIKCFKTDAGKLSSLQYRSVPAWDSISHMVLISSLEKEFNILMDTADILTFGSYENGKNILRKYDIEIL